MGHTETMEDVLRYIDEHISRGLTAEELARVSGYSFYHFCHLFAIDMGLSVGAYLRRRRLELAAGEILQGGSITEISTKSGFETPSGFSKAFRRHYGMAPTEYKSKKGEIDVMTPEIKYVEGFSAVGYCLAPPEGEFDVLDASAYWLGKDFSSVSRADYAKLTYPGYAEIGAWMHPDQVAGEFYYFFGPQVKEKSFIPDGMVPLTSRRQNMRYFSFQEGRRWKKSGQMFARPGNTFFRSGLTRANTNLIPPRSTLNITWVRMPLFMCRL